MEKISKKTKPIEEEIAMDLLPEQTAALFKLSKAFALTKDKVELLQLINNEVKAIIPFDLPALFIVNEEQDYHYDITVVRPETNKDKESLVLSQIAEEKIPHRNSAIEEVMKYEGAKLWNWKVDLADKGFTHPYLPSAVEYKIIYAIVCPLKVGGRIFGFFSVSSAVDIYTVKQLPLFEAVTDIIAIAANTILAKEEIAEREKEKTLLLSLSEDMSSIRNTEELFTVIWKKIKPIVAFEDAVVSIYSKDFSSYKHFIIASPPERKTHSKYREIINVFLPVANTPDEYVLNQITEKGILRWDTDNIIKAFPKHFIGHFLKENNLLYNIYQKISWAGNIIGFMNFHFTDQSFIQQNKYNLYKSIGGQVGVAIANILANEEIAEREQEKTILLSISEAVATIRNKKDLLELVFEKVKPLFNFYDTGFFVIDEANGFIEDWSVTIDGVSPSENNRKLKTAGAGKFSLHTPSLQWAIDEIKKTEGPLVFRYNDELLKRFPEYPQFKIMQQFGVAESLSTLLRNDKKETGILFFNATTEGHFKQNKFQLFQAIADQLAVAVSNILANEEIAAKEKIKSLQIEIGKALAEEGGWNKRLLRCAKILQKEIEYSLLLITIMMDDENFITHGFYQTGREEYQILDEGALQRILDLKPEPFKEHWRKVGGRLTGPVAYSEEDFDSIVKQHPIRLNI